MPTNNHDKLDYKSINDTVNLSKKILHLLYIFMIIGVILLITMIIQRWQVPNILIKVFSLFTPLFIGYIIAWLFSPLVKFLNNNGIKKGIAVAIVYIGLLAVLYLFISMLIPTIIDQFNDLVSTLPSIFNSIKEFIEDFFDSFNSLDSSNISTIKTSVYTNISNLFNSIVEGLPNRFVSILGSFASGVGTLLISLIIGFYMLLDFDSIKTHFIKLLPSKYAQETTNLIDSIGKQLRRYVHGVLGVSSIIFIGCSIGFALIGLKAPILFGLFCGITDLIPYVGPYIGGAAAVVVGFSQSTTTGLLAILIVVIFQVIESYIVQPIVMSKTMKLHPVTIIIGLMIFGELFGIIGMVIATPCISLIKIIFNFFNDKYNWIDFDKKNSKKVSQDEC